jgi:hypothetical protein
MEELARSYGVWREAAAAFLIARGRDVTLANLRSLEDALDILLLPKFGEHEQVPRVPPAAASAANMTEDSGRSKVNSSARNVNPVTPVTPVGKGHSSDFNKSSRPSARAVPSMSSTADNDPVTPIRKGDSSYTTDGFNTPTADTVVWFSSKKKVYHRIGSGCQSTSKAKSNGSQDSKAKLDASGWRMCEKCQDDGL